MKRIWHPAVPPVLLAAACLAAPRSHAQPRPLSPTAEQRHTGEIYCAEISPDGKTIATGSEDCAVKLWDVATARLKHTLVPPRAVWDVAFSLDGENIATGGDDRIVRIWQVATGRLLQALAGGPKEITSVAFSLDGRLLACASNEKTPAGVVRLWETRSWRAVRDFRMANVDVLRFSPDSRMLACCAGDDLTGWSTVTGKRRLQMAIHGYGGVHEIAFSPDGKQIAVALFERETSVLIGKVRLVDIQKRRVVRQIRFGVGDAFCVASLPDGHTAAIGRGEGRFTLWNTRTGHRGDVDYHIRGRGVLIRRLRGGRHVLLAYGSAPSGDYIPDDGKLLLIDWKTRKTLCTLNVRVPPKPIR